MNFANAVLWFYALRRRPILRFWVVATKFCLTTITALFQNTENVFPLFGRGLAILSLRGLVTVKYE
jgi:hypothetical protein